jgi:hypothetical protein
MFKRSTNTDEECAKYRLGEKMIPSSFSVKNMKRWRNHHPAAECARQNSERGMCGSDGHIPSTPGALAW